MRARNRAACHPDWASKGSIGSLQVAQGPPDVLELLATRSTSRHARKPLWKRNS